MSRWLAVVLVVPGVASAQHEFLPPATVVFEDIPEAYPRSDMDLNDVALRYSARCDLVGAGIVRQVVHFAAVAAGARKENALDVALPAAATVRLGLDGGPLEPLPVVGGKVRLFEDFRRAFVGVSGGFVNTEGDDAFVAGRPGVLELVFDAPYMSDCPDVAFEVRRPELVAPITLATTVQPNNQPITGQFDGAWSVPRETTPIWEAYPNFLDWVSDACDTPECEAWALHPVQSAVIARSEPNLELYAPLPELPTCAVGLPCGDALGVCPCPPFYGDAQSVPGLSCADILAARHDPPSDVYWIEPAAGDPANAFEVYCDMDTDEGGWTLFTTIATTMQAGGWTPYLSSSLGWADPWTTRFARKPAGTVLRVHVEGTGWFLTMKSAAPTGAFGLDPCVESPQSGTVLIGSEAVVGVPTFLGVNNNKGAGCDGIGMLISGRTADNQKLEIKGVVPASDGAFDYFAIWGGLQHWYVAPPSSQGGFKTQCDPAANDVNYRCSGFLDDPNWTAIRLFYR